MCSICVNPVSADTKIVPAPLSGRRVVVGDVQICVYKLIPLIVFVCGTVLLLWEACCDIYIWKTPLPVPYTDLSLLALFRYTYLCITHAYTYMHTYMYVFAHSHTNAYTNAYTHNTHTQTHTYIYVLNTTRLPHTPTRTHTHTHTRTHTGSARTHINTHRVC